MPAYLIAFLLTAPSAAPPSPPTWPQWRGPGRDCIVGGPAWPSTLQGAALKELWRVELAEGYPGPVVVGNRVFVAETKDRKDEITRALDRRTGKQLWEHSWKGSMTVPFFAA